MVDTKPPDHEATPNPLSVDQLPSDIFRNDANAALLVSSDSSPADNLKALVQECGVAPHKISELLHELPPRQLTDKLVDVYFTGMYVFSTVFVSNLISTICIVTGLATQFQRRISVQAIAQSIMMVPP